MSPRARNIVIASTIVCLIAACGIWYFRANYSAAAPGCDFLGIPPGENPQYVETETYLSGFSKPLGIRWTEAGAFVYTKAGQVWHVTGPDKSQRKQVLDIHERVHSNDFEVGLLSVSFPPNFPEDPRFFAVYIHSVKDPEFYWRLVEFTVDPKTMVADPNSERQLIEYFKETASHNAGDSHFGPDGYLYVSTGDGNHHGDPNHTSQDLRDFRGSFLRVDVNSATKPYGIPPDNPNWDQPGAKREVFAHGFRNPWRFSFDKETGEIWTGDVGDRTNEEIDKVEKGKNYGWRYIEGAFCRMGKNCQRPELVPPVYFYPRDVGSSVIGGYIYRGKKIPWLYGQYVFGDYGSTSIFALQMVDGKVVNRDTLVRSNSRIVGLGEDPDGELYFVELDGSIKKIVDPSKVKSTKKFPALLSETRCFRDLKTLEPRRGGVPYKPNALMWRDGTQSSQFIFLPKGKRILAAYGSPWEFPDETVVIKNFLAKSAGDQLKPIETQVLVKKSGITRGYTYQWNEAGDDAVLLNEAKDQIYKVATEKGELTDLAYHFPSRDECRLCHNSSSPSSIMAVNDSQLCQRIPKKIVDCPDIQAISERRFIDPKKFLSFKPPVKEPLPDYRDENVPVEPRARAYLHANCSYCHNPTAYVGQTPLDFRMTTPMRDMNICDKGLINPLFAEDIKVLKPGDPEHSAIYLRMTATAPHLRMPPQLTYAVDEYGARLIRSWIQSTTTCDDRVNDQ